MSYEGQTYAIRFRRQARQDMDEARERLADIMSQDHADNWHDGLIDSLAGLATNPNRYPLAHENRLFQDDVHVFPYRRSRDSIAYRVFYTIAEATDDDAAFVYVLHIRHGARKPMTRAEVQKIEEK